MEHFGQAEVAKSEVTGVSLIIPAFNEEAAVGSTIENLIPVLIESAIQFEIIVVDDGSTDGTVGAVDRSKVRLIQHRRNKGYGAALKTGILAATKDIVLFYDADGQFEPRDVLPLIAALRHADAAIGARTAESYTPFRRRGGKMLLGWFANYMARSKIPDLNCGLRAVRRDVALRYLHLLPQGFSASTTLTMILLKEDHDVTFVPVTVKKRVGQSTVRFFKDGLEVFMLIIRLTTLLDPFRVFWPISLLLILTGFFWSIPYFLMRRGLSSTALFLMLSGVMIFFFGLLADQVAALRREQQTSYRKDRQ